ncbi:MAG TPA: hypothetical protein VM657_03180 [Sphingomonas sp.]|nr:hypothetical protein [Sphingomonas sp.]
MAKALDTFSITPVGEDYLLQIEDEDGEAHEWTLSVDQLDLIAEELDQILDADEDEELGVEDEEEPDAA